jgi:pyruvate,water dikinase
MNSIYWLTQIQDRHRLSVGDRVWNLSQLLQQGYPVLPGLAIPNEIRQQFLNALEWSYPILGQKSDGRLSEVFQETLEDRDLQLRQMTQRIREQILSSPLNWPGYNRVVEAIATWEGDFVLCRPSLSLPKRSNPQGYRGLSGLWTAWGSPKSPDALAQTIKQIWAETFRNKYLLYWQYQGISLHQIRLGILIQPLHNEVMSGAIATQDHEIEIEATWGLGYLFNKPQVSSDRYQIELEPYQIKEQHLGNKRIADQLCGEASSLPLNMPLFEAKDESLCAYILDASLVDQPCLNEAQIQCLGDRALSLKNQWYGRFRLEWIGIPDLNWWITDVIPLNDKKPSLLPHKGIGASPGVAMAPVLVLPDRLESMSLKPGQIMVKGAIAPQDTWILKEAAGLITEEGGITSHGAIVARELGIPAIVGVEQATHHLLSGETIRMNGETGEISLGTNYDASDPIQVTVGVKNFSPLHATQLWINLSQPHSVYPSDTEVDGVGLIRSELWAARLFSGIQWWRDVDRFTSEWLKHLQELVKSFYPRPIYYRAFDSFDPSPVRGIVACEVNEQRSALFDLELTVLEKLHGQGYQNLHLMLPFVRTVEDVVAIRKRVDQRQLSQMELWIMVEVPGVLFQISEYIQVGIDGLSVGTNDLIPLLFGLERQQWEANKRGLNALHPVVLKALEQCITEARAGGIQSSVCGQAVVNHPALIEHLVRWGITSISVEMPAVDRVRRAIARGEQQLILEAARSQLKIKN